MPPKKTAQRRSRKETAEGDLTKLLVDDDSINDEKVFPILKEALNEGVDVDLVVDGQTLICYFAFYGMLKCFEECFLFGADPTIVTSKFSKDALVSAVKGLASAETSRRMVMFLLKHEKVSDLDHQYAVTSACELGLFEVIRPLLRRNNSFADTVLWMGVWRGSSKLVEAALEFNAKVDQQLRDDRYLIHKAAELPDSSILQMLLDAGADIEMKNRSTNETAFEVAIRFNCVNCVRLLIGKKCEFSSEDAMLLAIRCRNPDVLTELLRNEKFRAVVSENWEALFTAVSHDDLTAFRIIYPIVSFHVLFITRLVRFEKYDMLSAALFEFEHPGLSTQHLTQWIAEAPNDDFKALLQKKIDMMNGVDVVLKVKEEAEEEAGGNKK